MYKYDPPLPIRLTNVKMIKKGLLKKKMRERFYQSSDWSSGLLSLSAFTFSGPFRTCSITVCASVFTSSRVLGSASTVSNNASPPSLFSNLQYRSAVKTKAIYITLNISTWINLKDLVVIHFCFTQILYTIKTSPYFIC